MTPADDSHAERAGRGEWEMSEDYKIRIEAALEYAYQYGQIDGGHHKAWVIDQMVKALLGKKYEAWIKDYEDDGEYEWDKGIAP